MNHLKPKSFSHRLIDGIFAMASMIWRIAFNIVLTAIMIGLACLWYPFIFGSVVGVIIILVFAPSVFVLPFWLAIFYKSLDSDIF